MRTVKHIITGVIWAIVGLYLLAVVLVQLPPVQRFLGSQVAQVVGNKLNTEVQVKKVNLGLLNRIIIDDVLIYDQSKKPMLKASRASVKLSLYDLLYKKKVSISSAQLFGMQADLYKKDAQSPTNYQFALDALASKDSVKKASPEVSINSLVIRHGNINYDRWDIPNTDRKFSTDHLHLRDISMHALIPSLNDDGLDLIMKKLAMKEEVSGTVIKSLAFKLNRSNEKILLSNLSLELPNTALNVDSLVLTNPNKEEKFNFQQFGLKGKISDSKVLLNDLSGFLPALSSFSQPLHLNTSFEGSNNILNVNTLNIHSGDELAVVADGTLTHWLQHPALEVHFDQMKVNGSMLQSLAGNPRSDNSIFQTLSRLGDIQYVGNMRLSDRQYALNGNLTTSVGNATVDAVKKQQQFSAQLQTDNLDLGKIIADNRLGTLSADVEVSGLLPANSNSLFHPQTLLTVKGDIPHVDFQNYTYKNINVDGTFRNKVFDGVLMMDDPNGVLHLDGIVGINGKMIDGKMNLTLQNFNPHAMKITGDWENTTFNANMEADVKGSSLNDMTGNILIDDFSFFSPEQQYELKQLSLVSEETASGRQLEVNSDFGSLKVNGRYDYSTIVNSVMNMLADRIPTLPGIIKRQPKTGKSYNNAFTLQSTINKTDWLQAFTGLPVSLHAPMKMNAMVDDANNQLQLNLSLPNFSYNGNNYQAFSLKADTDEDKNINFRVKGKKVMDNKEMMDIGLEALAGNNSLESVLTWEGDGQWHMKGSLRSSTDFFKTPEGKQAAHMRVHHSDILINDTIWRVQPSDIVYCDNDLTVDYFAVEHQDQHIIVYGKADKNPDDSLVIDMKGVDVRYILDLVNFHSVTFDGKATGKALIRSAFSNFQADADLRVDDFRFQEGRMGTLFAKASWNTEEKQIDIDAHADDENHAQTIIKGYVSPSKNYIDLNIDANNTRGEFLKSFCGSFMDNINLRCNGSLNLFGDLKLINLTGMVVADGDLDIKTLNTHYWLRGDTIRLIPNEIIFHQDTIYDRHNNIGIINGALHHIYLTRLTYDLDINAQNLLCYDFHDYGDDTFFGTVYGTGDCAIKGRNGRIDFDINVTPEKGSFIEYNAASPDAITDQGFITWRDRLAMDSVENEELARPIVMDDDVSDIHLNFLINANPNATLRLLMDRQSGDYIALNGNGAIRASYYNKGSFNMFGTYMVDHGVYKLTIQNVIKKDFQFQDGSSIVFGGDPYEAALDLKALYTINGVSLSDLQLGRSFTSNNVRVDCMMNIGGTASAPRVDFDLDMPTVSADANQMIRSLINSEEEMNQQVIYLLSIGRFYNQQENNAGENNSQSQTSLAMQSLLSGTISQQISNVLSNFVNSNNWNFGANISTGDEGFNNAEYEGLLSGRLLNNRLLINGQFGYRDNANATTSFIGDFDIRYLLFPNGNLAIKVYNQTNDRYFTKNSLNTQGIGLILKKDFNNWRDLFGIVRKKESEEKEK
ncbi:MAG: translocation/assembly module TamB [Prevotella sp.]|nr:translocation/assembly module TamB [Prevotella sp.]